MNVKNALALNKSKRAEIKSLAISEFPQTTQERKLLGDFTGNLNIEIGSLVSPLMGDYKPLIKEKGVIQVNASTLDAQGLRNFQAEKIILNSTYVGRGSLFHAHTKEIVIGKRLERLDTQALSFITGLEKSSLKIPNRVEIHSYAFDSTAIKQLIVSGRSLHVRALDGSAASELIIQNNSTSEEPYYSGVLGEIGLTNKVVIDDPNLYLSEGALLFDRFMKDEASRNVEIIIGRLKQFENGVVQATKKWLSHNTISFKTPYGDPYPIGKGYASIP